MSDPASPPPPLVPEPIPPATTRSSTLSIVAIVVAGLGFVLAVLPPTAWIAWLPLVTGIVLGIVALVRRSGMKGLAIAAIIVGAVGWLIAILVSIGSFVSGVGDALDDPPPAVTQPDDQPGGGEEDPPAQEEEEESTEAGIGETVTNADGVSFTVDSVTCGITTAGPEFLQETASGQFCEVGFTVDNGSNEAISVYASDVTATIGEAEYEANSTISQVGEDYFATDVNPGLSTQGKVYIDIPADAALDYITYDPLFSFLTGPVIIRVA